MNDFAGVQHVSFCDTHADYNSYSLSFQHSSNFNNLFKISSSNSQCLHFAEHFISLQSSSSDNTFGDIRFDLLAYFCVVNESEIARLKVHQKNLN